MDLREIGWGSVDWIQLARDKDRWRALVNTVMNLRVLAPRSYLLSVSQIVVRGGPQVVSREERITKIVSDTERMQNTPIHVCAKTVFFG
jgi:hypothetical protein